MGVASGVYTYRPACGWCRSRRRRRVAPLGTTGETRAPFGKTLDTAGRALLDILDQAIPRQIQAAPALPGASAIGLDGRARRIRCAPETFGNLQHHCPVPPCSAETFGQPSAVICNVLSGFVGVGSPTWSSGARMGRAIGTCDARNSLRRVNVSRSVSSQAGVNLSCRNLLDPDRIQDFVSTPCNPVTCQHGMNTLTASVGAGPTCPTYAARNPEIRTPFACASQDPPT
jgi:hypothetical protein